MGDDHRRRKAAKNDGEADNAWHLPVPPSFDDGDPFSAKTTRTISSTLDDLQSDITLQIHERISEFLSLRHYPSSLRNRRDARTHSVERKRKKRQRLKGRLKRWDKSSPPLPI